MKSERQLDLKEKVKRIAFVQVSMTKISKSELKQATDILFIYHATRLNSVIAAGDIMQRYLHFL